MPLTQQPSTPQARESDHHPFREESARLIPESFRLGATPTLERIEKLVTVAACLNWRNYARVSLQTVVVVVIAGSLWLTFTSPVLCFDRSTFEATSTRRSIRGGNWRQESPTSLLSASQSSVTPAISLPTDLFRAHPSTDLPTVHTVNGWSSYGQVPGSPTVHSTDAPVTTLHTGSSIARVVIDRAGSRAIINKPTVNPSTSSDSLTAIAMTDATRTHLAVDLPSNKLITEGMSHTTPSLPSLSSITPSSRCDYTRFVDATSHDVTTTADAPICIVVTSSHAPLHHAHTIEIEDILFAGNHGACRIVSSDIIIYKPDADFHGTDVCVYRTHNESQFITIRVIPDNENLETHASCSPIRISPFFIFIFFLCGCGGLYKWRITTVTPASVMLSNVPKNEQAEVYATPIPFNTRTESEIPNTHESGINPALTWQVHTIYTELEAVCNDASLDEVQGVHGSNVHSNQVYTTPLQSTSITDGWVPNTDESGINPEMILTFQTFESTMQAACGDMRMDEVQGVPGGDDDDDEEDELSGRELDPPKSFTSYSK